MYTELKNDILGKDYNLSIAFVTPKISRELNKKYRKKDRATNVLSFALAKNFGELVLCKAVIKDEAKNLGKTIPKWTGFLVIHGMLHLKGMEHSVRMEKAEATYDQKYFSGNRRGLRDDASNRRRIYRGRKKS